MASVTETPTAQSSSPSSSDTRGRLIVLVMLGLVVCGSVGWWVLNRQSSVDVVVTSVSGARGIGLEATYSPVLPTTVIGAAVETSAGRDDSPSLYDPSTDSDLPPASVSVRAGRGVVVYATVVPDCTATTPTDQVQVQVETTSGDRTLSTELDGFARAVSRLCRGPVHFDLSQSKRAGDVVTATYQTLPIAQQVQLAIRGTRFSADPIVLEPGTGAVQWTITTARGCAAATSPVVAVATYQDGSQKTVRLTPPGSELC